MTKEKIFSFIKKAFTYIFKGVIIGISIALMFVIACIYISVLSKAVDVAYNDDGIFADLVDEIADIFSDDNNSSSGTKDIVANAQVIDGIDYPSLDTSDLVLFHSESDVSIQRFNIGGAVDDFRYSYMYLGDSGELLFSQYSTYYLDFVLDGGEYCYGYFVSSDNIILPFYLSEYSAVSCFALCNDLLYMSNISTYCYILFNDVTEEYYLFIYDVDDDFGGLDVDVNIYSFPSSQPSNSVDNIGSIIASGMTFGLDGITSSVSTAFDSVFLDNDGNLSNYSIFVFWALGVSVALGFFKYILDWILSLGSRK